MAVLPQAKKDLGVGVLMAGARVALQMTKHQEGIIQPLASMPLPLRSPMPAATINRFTCVLCVTDFSSRLEISIKDLDGDFPSLFTQKIPRQVAHYWFGNARVLVLY